MFEKESKRFADSLEEDAEIGIDNTIDVFFRDTIEYAFQQGAEYGYNKAKEEMQSSALNSLAEAIETWR